jgi:cytochrome b561
MPEVHWGLSAAAVAGGWAGFHAVFGLLLCALVASRFLRYTGGAAEARGADLLPLARHLSRAIYLILYGVLLLRVISDAMTWSWHGGPAWAFSPRFLAEPERVFIECGERFRLDLVWGVIALCLVRALAAHHLRAAASMMDMPLRRNSPLQPPRPEARS